MYSKILMDHFKNPRNQGVIKNADGVGEAGNPLCGDVMRMYLRATPRFARGLRDIRNLPVGRHGERNGRSENDVIKDIKFETLGCAAAIANSSILTTMVKGKTIAEAQKIKREDIVKELGGVPMPKVHCSLLATEALGKAIGDYLGHTNDDTNEY